MTQILTLILVYVSIYVLPRVRISSYCLFDMAVSGQLWNRVKCNGARKITFRRYFNVFLKNCGIPFLPYIFQG